LLKRPVNFGAIVCAGIPICKHFRIKSNSMGFASFYFVHRYFVMKLPSPFSSQIIVISEACWVRKIYRNFFNQFARDIKVQPCRKESVRYNFGTKIGCFDFVLGLSLPI
jgi:hypothetical protein